MTKDSKAPAADLDDAEVDAIQGGVSGSAAPNSGIVGNRARWSAAPDSAISETPSRIRPS